MKVRILSIDGGGARGIIPIVILEYIENKIQEIVGNERVKLSNFLDFVGGTAAGAVITGMITTPDYTNQSKPAYTASEMIDLFFDYVQSSVSKKNWKTLWGLYGPKYNQQQLSNKHIDIFDHWKMKDLLLPIVITGYDILNRHPVIFTNKDEFKKYEDLYIKDIIQGSVTPPSWFNPASFRDGISKNVIVTANVIANNPSMISFIEAGKTPSIIEKFGNHITPKNTFLISLGTGQSKFHGYTIDDVKRWNKSRWFNLLTSMNIQSSTILSEYETSSLFNAYKVPENYIRIDPAVQLGSSNPMNTSKDNIKHLLQDAKNYIERNIKLLDEVADKLVKENIIYRSLI